MELGDDRWCFACGENNPHGLKLDFVLDEANKTMRVEYVPQKWHQSYTDITHGGIISTILDEAMGKLSYVLGQKAVTAKLSVKYKRPLKVGERAIFTGWIVRQSGRAIHAEGKAELADGTVIAESKALLMVVGKRS